MRFPHTLALLTSALAACSSNVTPGNDAAADSPAADSPTMDTGAVDSGVSETGTLDSSADSGTADAGPQAAWISRTDTFVDAQIRVQRVVYRSGGLAVQGQLCVPLSAGRHPILVFNHGGFSGLTDELTSDTSFCRSAARNGYVVTEASYRGEDGSEGNVEVCLGEADDSLALLDLVRAEPFADGARVAIEGGSHGGCITLRMVQRGAPAQVAVDFFGPTDWALEYRFWEQQLTAGPPNYVAVYQSLIDTMRTAAGGTPDEVPAEYARRSPMSFVAALTASPTALQILHGSADLLVPTAQSCALVAAAGGFENYHLDGMQMQTTAAPTGCESYGLTITGTPRPRMSWPGARYFIVYDGMGHELTSVPAQTAVSDFLDYVVTRFPAR